MRRFALLPLLALVLPAAACSSGGTPAAPPAPQKQAIRVYAAASLQQLFTDLGKDYTNKTGVPVELTFGGSADLLTQLTNGSPGDVLITADEATMQKAQTAKVVTAEPKVVATNTLVIAVRPGNPKHIATYADLAKPDTTLVRCAKQVPCGAASQKVEQAAHVTTTPVSEENSVTDVLGKVTSGQADAGLVYATDVARSQGKAEAVTFPEAAGVVNRYPIAPIAATKDGQAAQGFIDHVSGPAGSEAFQKAGFGKP